MGVSLASNERHRVDGREWLQRRQVGVYAVAVLLAVAVGVGRPTAAPTVEQFIDSVLAMLLYVTFLEVPFVRLRRAFRNRRFVAAALRATTGTWP